MARLNTKSCGGFLCLTKQRNCKRVFLPSDSCLTPVQLLNSYASLASGTFAQAPQTKQWEGGQALLLSCGNARCPFLALATFIVRRYLGRLKRRHVPPGQLTISGTLRPPSGSGELLEISYQSEAIIPQSVTKACKCSTGAKRS